MENLENSQLEMLIQSLQLLAADYERQAQALPAFVDVPDEVALTFDEVYPLVDNLVKENRVTSDQKAALEQINSLLDQMSDIENLWSPEALQSSPQWQNVRLLAENTLRLFQIPKQPPHLFWLQYVPSKKDESV